MTTSINGKTAPESITSSFVGVEMPVLAVAYAPEGACTVDRCLIAPPFTVGRGPDCQLAIRDKKVSKAHARITQNAEGYWLEDLGSRNGTFVGGLPVMGKIPLSGSAVIRIGSAVMVFLDDGAPLLAPPLTERFDIAGVFHTGPLLEAFSDAARSARHLLLVGPTGTGKELAAQAIARMTAAERGSPPTMLTHNAARFSSEEEAAATLFGVNPRVFSGVDERAGLIEQAHGGILFLDEVHNLPPRVQRSLLRIIEDGRTARIGESATKTVEVRFILASNAEGQSRGLTEDLFARLRLVEIPPLAHRAADIPNIFDEVLGKTLSRYRLATPSVTAELNADHYEALCLDGFPTDNVRGLIDLADRIATRISRGQEPARAVEAVFSLKYGDGPIAGRHAPKQKKGRQHYEQNKTLIIAAYRECAGNLSAAERLLKSKGLSCSRRWLAHYLERWGVRDS